MERKKNSQWKCLAFNFNGIDQQLLFNFKIVISLYEDALFDDSKRSER